MKKLISAAAAMAMAASMVGSAVPFATGAADTSKGLYFDVLTGRDGKTKASTTISESDISAGDVTIPVGLFLDENSMDTKALQAEWTINAADGGDAANVSFEQILFSDNFYDADTEVAAGSQTFTSKKLIGFAGTITTNNRGSKWTELGGYTGSCRASSEVAGTKNAFGSAIWTAPATDTSEYQYTGSKSDDFPVFIFEVTFPKGTKAGTYTIDFLNYIYKDVPSTYIKNGSTLTLDSGIDSKGLTFTIEGDKVDPPVTTATPPVTTATPPATTATPPTTTTPNGDKEVKDDFTIEPKAMTVDLTKEEYKGQDFAVVEVPVIIDSNGRSAATLVFEPPVDLPAGWEIEIEDLTCYCVDFEPTFTKLANTYNVSVFDKKTGHPTPINDGTEMVFINVKIPTTAEAGDYEYFFSRFTVVESTTTTSAVTYDGKILPGKITIVNDAEPEKTTAPQTTATTKPTTATTATTKPNGDLTPLYGDASDDGVVNIADVVVLNKWLHENSDYPMTDQGKLNANCCDVSAGEINAEDSDAIIKSIVHLVTLPCAASDLK